MKTIEQNLDEIVASIPPVVDAGWVRKQDVGDFAIYELRVPKNYRNALAIRCTLEAPYDLSKPSLTWEEAASKVHTEYQVPYAADGNYHIPDHAGDTIKILRPEGE